MPDQAKPPEMKPADDATATPAAPPTPPRRSPGHRGADVRDTVAEMAAKAQEISQEAGSKMAAAMKDVINAAAGIAGFAVESARDLAQYMVRRGQMTQEEADKLIREAEAAQVGRPPVAPRPAPPKAPAATAESEPARVTFTPPMPPRPVAPPAAPPPMPARPAAPAPTRPAPTAAKSAPHSASVAKKAAAPVKPAPKPAPPKAAAKKALPAKKAPAKPAPKSAKKAPPAKSGKKR